MTTEETKQLKEEECNSKIDLNLFRFDFRFISFNGTFIKSI
jgi:hypothetical protein